jgi:hypothetical protein
MKIKCSNDFFSMMIEWYFFYITGNIHYDILATRKGNDVKSTQPTFLLNGKELNNLR